MKNNILYFSLLFIFVISFSSCDDDETVPANSISNQLSTSKTAYDEATDGDWIAITETEYNLLASALTNVSISGTVDSLFVDTVAHLNDNNSVTWSNANSATMAEGSYLFAFKYLPSSSSDDNLNSTVKISTTGRYADLTDFGSVLPKQTGNGVMYYVIKNSNTPIETGKTGYLAMYYSEGVKYWYKTPSTTSLNVDMKFGSGNVTSTPNNSAGILLYQGLSSTDKQW